MADPFDRGNSAGLDGALLTTSIPTKEKDEKSESVRDCADPKTPASVVRWVDAGVLSISGNMSEGRQP